MSKFDSLKRFEAYSDLETEVLDLSEVKDNKVLVVKIDIMKYGVDVAADIFKSIQDNYPNVPMIGLAKDIELTIEDIDTLIAYFTDLRDGRK